MNEKMNKKQLTLTIVAVVTLIALVAGATYAYFAVGVNTEGFTTQNINANAESVGNVILTKTGNGIYLNLSRVNMMKQYDNETPKDVTYYGVDTPTGSPVTTENRIPIGTATVTGEGNYNCTYSLTVTNANSSATNNMYTAFQEWKTNGYYENETLVSAASNATTGQIVLNVGGTEYDFYNANVFNTKATGTLSNITSENAKTIEAYMYVKNDGNKNQNAIAGTEINIEVTVDSFSCTAVEAPSTQVLTSRTEYWTYEGSNVTYATASPKYTEAQKSQIPNNYYIKTTITPTVATHEVCAKINEQEVCMEPNHWDIAETYKAVFENQTIGWQCIYTDYDNFEETNTKPSNGSLKCSANDPSNLSSELFECRADSDGNVFCTDYDNHECRIYDGYSECKSLNVGGNQD